VKALGRAEWELSLISAGATDQVRCVGACVHAANERTTNKTKQTPARTTYGQSVGATLFDHVPCQLTVGQRDSVTETAMTAVGPNPGSPGTRVVFHLRTGALVSMVVGCVVCVSVSA